MQNSLWFPFNISTEQPLFRLFCFHHSGAGASVFRKWASFFPNIIQVVPVQLPGREGRFNEPFIETLDAFVDAFIPELIKFNRLPFALFGHSLGGLLAYITNLELQKLGMPTEHLFISACLPPGEIRRRQPIYNLSDRKFLKIIQSYKGLPNQILENKDMINLLLPRLRSDFGLFESSNNLVNTYVNNPISIYYGSNDLIAPKKQLTSWENYSNTTVMFEEFLGDHFFYQKLQEDVCKKINQTISNLLSESSLI